MKMVSKVMSAVVVALSVAPAYAQEGEAMVKSDSLGIVALGVGLIMGLAAIGGTLGQGKAVAAAMDGIARNPGAQPKMFIPMILGLALIESLVVLAFVIAQMLLGKV